MPGARSDLIYPARLLSLAGSLILGSPVFAGDWQRSISVPVTFEADSNPTLGTQGSTDLKRTRIAPSLKLNGDFGTDDFWTSASVLVERSSDKNVSLPRQDPSFQFGWRHMFSTGEYGLVANYQEASTRVSELEETGLITKDGTRRSRSIAGNWKMAFSERSTLGITADHSTVGFDSGSQTGSSNTSLGVTYNLSWSDRIEPFLRISASHYVPESNTTSSDNTTFLAGARIASSDKVEWTIQGGPSRISAATSSSKWQGSIGLRHTGRRHTTTFEIARSVSATGANGFVESDRLKGGFAYTFDERTHAGVDILRTDNKGLIRNTMDQLGLWTNHELSRYWNARLNFTHKKRQQSGLDSASSNIVGLTLSYAPPGF